VDLHRHPTATPIPGVLVVRPDGPVFYVNAQSVQDTIETLLAAHPDHVHSVVIDLDANDELDITASEKLAKLVSDLQAKDIKVGFAHLHTPALDMARKAGVLDDTVKLPVFESMAAALVWAQSNGSAPPTDSDRTDDP
jgi:MFS superfamily sulfate permease-like transporter